MANVNYKDIELGFVRKSDGKVVNVKLLDIFKQFSSTDFINNEIKINGETLVADSFCAPYEEATLNVKVNAVSGAAGTYQVNGQLFKDNQAFTVAKNTAMQVALIPDANSVATSVIDGSKSLQDAGGNTVTVQMDADHTLTIQFSPVVS